MQFSKLSARITLEEMQETKDSDSGELLRSVLRTLDVWAEIKPQPGIAQQGALGGIATLGVQVFVIRYRKDIKSETWRIKDATGDYWDIIDIPRAIENNSMLELTCQRTGKNEG